MNEIPLNTKPVELTVHDYIHLLINDDIDIKIVKKGNKHTIYFCEQFWHNPQIEFVSYEQFFGEEQ